MLDATLLPAYRIGARLVTPLAPTFLRWRLRRGKEDARRLGERLGRAGRPREPGPLVWAHGASVGEGLALLTLVPKLTNRGRHVLLTTGTVTSARLLAPRLPPATLHQFAPIDAPACAERFLDHWRPDLILFAESELWPNALAETRRRGIPVALVNARMSPRSFARWSRFPKSAAAVLAAVDLCLAQSSADAERFLRLGARDVRIVGNLKYDAPAPPVDQAELARLAGAIGPRPVWIAASTHDGEEAIALSVHRRLQARFPNLLTIIAPRHPERGALVAELAARHSLVCSRRSIGGSVEPSTQVYVSDTIGEAGLYYRLASIVFIGKSLAGGGGQNPIEPAKLGGVVLHGPHVGNFDDVYGDLDARGGAHRVEDEAGLAAQVGHLLADPARLRRMARAGAESVERFAGAADATLQALSPWLAERAPDAA